MTEETKKVFNAPWYVDVHAVDGIDGETYVFDGVYNDKAELVCGNIQKHVTSNRLTHLPELYDKLMWAVVQKCPDAFLTLDECRLCVDKKCKYREIVELLRIVREGK